MYRGKIIGAFMLATIVSGSMSTVAYNNNNQNNNMSIVYESNNWSDVSNENPLTFDAPKAESNGVLERMPSTEIQTKYGTMDVIKLNNGYETKNLSNPNAPILYTGTINNIYKIGGAVDLSELLNPKLTNGEGQSISGKIILPKVSTDKSILGENFIEAVGKDGAVTIAPFIYNVVQFKKELNIQNKEQLKNLKAEDILESGSEGLRAYVGNYNEGSKEIEVGVSRGMATAQEEMPLNIGGNASVQAVQKQQTNNENNRSNNNLNITNNKPTLIKVLLSKWTYIAIGVILIAIISFICFRKED